MTYMSDESSFSARSRPSASSATDSDFRRNSPDRIDQSMINYVPKTSAQIARHMATEGRGLRGKEAKAERLRFMGFGNLYNKRKWDAYNIPGEDIVSDYESARDKLKAKAGWKRHFFWTDAAKNYKQSRNDLRHGYFGAAVGKLFGTQPGGTGPQPDEYQGDLNKLVDVGAGDSGEPAPIESEDDPYGLNVVQSGEIPDHAGEEEDERGLMTSQQIRDNEAFYDNLE
jgi:hypothetical protein